MMGAADKGSVHGDIHRAGIDAKSRCLSINGWWFYSLVSKVKLTIYTRAAHPIMARQSDRIDEWETEVCVADYVCQATMCSLTYPYKRTLLPCPFLLLTTHHLPSFLLDITNIMDIASIINPTTPDDAFTYCSSTPKPFFLNTMSSSSNTPSPTDSVFHVCVSESTCHRHPPSVLPKKQPILDDDDDDDERVPVPPLHAMPIKKRPLQQQPDNNDNTKGIRRRKRGLDDPVSLVSLSIHKPRRRTNKRHPTTKKAETHAALAYDTIDPEAPESEIFDASCWIPDIRVFDAKPTVSVRWKGMRPGVI